MKNLTKLAFLAFLWICISIMIQSCSTDDPTPPDSTVTVTADAGIDQTVDSGSIITLDGSSSFASDGGPLTFIWIVTTQPSGSTATLTGSTTDAPTFTPDLAGEYVFSLTVANADGVSDTDEISVTAEPVDLVIIETNITTPTTLENLTDGVDYLVKGFLSVEAALTIEPGVVIHFDSNAGFSIDESGSFNAIGTVSDSIIFTGATEVAGFWKGLLFTDSDNIINELTFCRVSYAGSNDLSSEVGKANIGVGYFLNPSRVKIKNSLIRNADGLGISMDYRADGRFPEFSDNAIKNNSGIAMRINVITAGDLDANTSFNNNGTDAVELLEKSSAAVISEDATWVALNNNVPYQIEANIHVEADLEIDAGAVLEFGSDKYMRVDENGSLLALGTVEQVIMFSGKTKTKGFWRGLYFEDSNNVINELANVVFEYGGSSDLTNQLEKTNFGIGYFLNPSKLKMTNVVSRESGGTGFAVDYRSNGELTTFSNNKFSNNTGYGLQITPFQLQYLDEATIYSESNGSDNILVSYAGSNAELDNDATWVAPTDGSKYIMDGNVIYNGNLTINPGVSFEFEANRGFNIEGSMSAIGTSEQHISFSSVTKSAGAWKGIKFDDSNNVINKLHFVDVSYGGSAANSVEKANLNVDQFSGFSTVDIQNSSFTNSAGYGIAISNNSSITQNNNSFSSNVSADIFQE